MGIRIHKVIGYGFKNCKFNKDPRFNEGVFSSDEGSLYGDLRPKMIDYIEKNSTDKKDVSDGVYNEKNSDYRCELAALKRVGLWSNLEDKPFDVCDVIKHNYYDMEKELPIGPVVFTIPYNNNWSRYDDIIDYTEETQNHEQQDRVNLIVDSQKQSRGIYPYEGSYVNRSTGERVKCFAFERNTVTQILRETKVSQLKEGNEYGFKTLIEWQRHIVPKLPPFIEIFCDCFNIFKNPLTKYRLRPMVYTYWS